MAEQSALRIQLEGQLEGVESAIEQWRQASRALRSPAWVNDHRWRSLPDVDDTVARKIGESAEAEIIESFRAAQNEARAAAVARLSEIGLHAEPTMALTVLRDEAPVLDVSWVTRAEMPLSPTEIVVGSVFAIAAWLVASKTAPEWFAGARETWRLGFLIIGGALLMTIGRLIRLFARARQSMRFILSLKSIRIFSAHRWVTLARDEIRAIRLRRRGDRWVLNLEARGVSKAIVLGQNRDDVVHALRENGLAVDTL